MVKARSPQSTEQADVLDMVARLKMAADARAEKAANVADMVAADDLDFPAEFYQYFTVVKAA